jgi:hypothetical protein
MIHFYFLRREIFDRQKVSALRAMQLCVNLGYIPLKSAFLYYDVCHGQYCKLGKSSHGTHEIVQMMVITTIFQSTYLKEVHESQLRINQNIMHFMKWLHPSSTYHV